jgi:hypothetical protein
MPTWGWLMIGVSNSAPRLPVLVSDLAGEAGDVEVTRVLDHRDHEAAVGVDGDAEVLGILVGDRAAGGVEHGVQLGVDLQRLDRGQREERQERELDAFAGLEGGLGPVAEPRDRRDVGLDDRRQLGRGLQ